MACVNCNFILCRSCHLDNLHEVAKLCLSRGNIDILEKKMASLRARKIDLQEKIKVVQKNCGLEASEEMKAWVSEVDKLDEAVSRIVANSQRCCYLGFKCKIQGKIDCVDEMLEQQTKLMTEFTEKPKISFPESSPTKIVGMEDEISKVLDYLDDDTVKVVGIHGMGGVGKTTLANQVIEKLQPSSSSASSASTMAAGEGQESEMFDVILRVVVSQNPAVLTLQENVALQLGIQESREFKDKDDRKRADFLSSHLSERRFLLVLDDVWEELDLNRIGIPELGRGKKVVLTSRREQVCTDMGARNSTVSVGCLGEEQSWELFKTRIQWKEDEFKERGVYEIAQEIVRKCGGLPLVLITIARALAPKKVKVSWENVRNQLQVSPNEIRGMSDVYRLLEVSYNNLEKEEYKSCLPYSALFPEDENIKIETLVDYCIGGGSLSEERYAKRCIADLRNVARCIVWELVEACLLERGKDEEHVKVHDAVRDMILNRIGRHDIGRKILSYEREYLLGTHDVDVEKWRAASMVSLSGNHIEELKMGEETDPGKSTALCWGKAERNGCQSNNLQVLLLDSGSIYARDSKFKLPTRLFEYFPSLRVLTLSRTNLEEIPESLCALESLRYLNMSFCRLLKALPKKMGKLKNLIQLDLSWTAGLSEIPTGLFSRLSKLQSLDLFGCDFFYNFDANRLRVLKEIGALRSLGDVGLSIAGDVRAVKLLVDYPHSLSNSITKLGVERVDLFEDELFKTMGSRLKNLKSLRISSVRNEKIEQLVFDDGHFAQLQELHIHYVDSFRHIIVKGQALKNLTHLKIFGCDKIEKLVEQPEGEGIFPNLQSIQLTNCSNLLEISTSPLQLPSLKKLDVNCTSLKNISTIDSSHKVEIHCQKMWWEELEWNNSERSSPTNFKPIFKVQVST